MSTSSVESATSPAAPNPAANAYNSTGGSNSKIDGLVSGLDTTAIINAVMAQAALPQTNLKNQLAAEQARLTAYQQLNTDMAGLQTAADALQSSSTWEAMAVTSSSASVAATASPGAQASTFSFDVTQLASGQGSVFANTVASTSAIVASPGTPVTITAGSGDPVTVNTGDGSLSAVAAGINAAGAGVQAAIVQVGTGQYRLQLTSATTGADASFSVSGLSGTLGALNNTSDAQDAEITVGAGTAGAYTISSSSNTFAHALPDMTFTVSQLASGVTLTTTSDSNGIADKVQAMVDAANTALSDISDDTTFNTTTDQGSVLTGDYTARQLRGDILSSVSSGLGLAGTSAANIGLAVTKDGQVTFDKSAFQAAFAADPASMRDAFSATGSLAPAQTGLSGGITLQRTTDATQAGGYDVTVTQAATQATGTIATAGGLAAGQTVTLGSGGATGTYTVAAGATAADVVNGLNSMAATKGLAVYASLAADGSTINLTSAGYGAEYTFTSSATGGLMASAVTAGLDVEGTINGQAASGIGQLLFTNPGTPGVDALTLKVTLTPGDVAALGGGSAGTFTIGAGIAQKLGGVSASAVARATGSLTSEIASAKTMISGFNDQISRWDVILQTKKTALERKWANLESQLSAIKGQSSSLSAAISSLPGMGSSSSNKSS